MTSIDTRDIPVGRGLDASAIPMQAGKAAENGVLSRLWQSGGALFPPGQGKSAVRRIGFLAAALPHLGRLGRWLDCRDNPALATELRASPQLLRLVDRPYVNRNWGVAERLQAVDQHYRALQGVGRLLELGANQYFDLLDLGPDFMGLRVVVDRPFWMRGEGEVAISLFCGADRVFAAMFLIVGEPGERSLVIGAFQGRGTEEAKETYVRLTKALHGLRPRDLLLNVLKIVASCLGCHELRGVSDACHRSRHPLVRVRKDASYDEVWQEHEGRLDDSGFFVMPVELRQRDLADIPSKKRAMYRRRYELLADIEARIRQSFASGERTLREHQVP